MKKLLFILMSVLAFLGWSTVCAQDYSAEFKDAEGAKSAFGVQNFTLAGKSWYATCGYYDNSAKDHFRLGRRTKDSTVAAKIESKFTSLGISEKGAVLEMKWDFENITAFNIVSSYNWDAGTKVFLLISTDGGTTYEILKTETIAEKDPSGAIVERIFSDGVAREKARYALALEGAKEGQCRLNLTKVFTNKRGDVDETAPEINFVVTDAAANTTIEVHFSEKLDKASAETIANYTLNNNITVSAAVLDHNVDSTDKTVILTTSAMTEGTAYELTVNGVKDAAGNATENLKYSFTFGAIEVDDIAAVLALRDSYVNAQQYRIKGEVVVVAHVGASIYVQDKNCPTTKGHSLLLYDKPKTYADRFPAGTVLTKVAGSLTLFAGTNSTTSTPLLEMQYLADDITENGTAEPVVSKATIKEVYKDVLYHAALVRFSDVVFSDDDQGGTFATGNYRIQDPSGKYMDLHVYASDNIVGETVPSEKVSITGYVGVYNGSSQLILRDKSDISTSTAVENNEAIRFSVYPNPTDGLLNVETEGNFRVSVYSLNGISLIRHNACETAQLDLSGLNQGVYIVEISTDKGNAYTKVVVR